MKLRAIYMISSYLGKITLVGTSTQSLIRLDGDY